MTNAINYQTESINNKKHQTDETAMTYAENARYQMEMYNSVKFVNKIFLSLYIILFIFIHVMFVIQYLGGVKRNPTTDLFWLLVFFFYPYLIYYIERTIYFGITYLLSLIYGQTYVYKFDKLLLFGEYYAEPVMHRV
jgi:hypothetical protein